MSRWPSGDCWTVAIFHDPPARFELDWNVRFQPGLDDLDWYRELEMFSEEFGHFSLWRYERAPDDGTELRVDRAIPRDDAMRMFKEEFGDSYKTKWLNEYAEFPAVAPIKWSP